MKRIKLEWTEEELKYFNKPIKAAKRKSWFNEDTLIWAGSIACAGVTIWILYKIYQLNRILEWVRSL